MCFARMVNIPVMSYADFKEQLYSLPPAPPAPPPVSCWHETPIFRPTPAKKEEEFHFLTDEDVQRILANLRYINFRP